MRAFVRLRQLLASNAKLAHKLAALERNDAQFKGVFDAIRELLARWTKRRRIGFQVQEQRARYGLGLSPRNSPRPPCGEKDRVRGIARLSCPRSVTGSWFKEPQWGAERGHLGNGTATRGKPVGRGELHNIPSRMRPPVGSGGGELHNLATSRMGGPTPNWRTSSRRSKRSTTLSSKASSMPSANSWLRRNPPRRKIGFQVKEGRARYGRGLPSEKSPRPRARGEGRGEGIVRTAVTPSVTGVRYKDDKRGG